MEPDRASRTAGYMAFYRALETARGDMGRISDPLAIHFLDSALARAARLSRVPPLGHLARWLSDLRAPGARTSGIARTWLIDDWLCEVLHHGIDQFVILGAGFDSRAYRLSCVRSIVVFEVDHPATLTVKRERLVRALSQVPTNVRLVAINFNSEDLRNALVNAGFDENRPAVFLWEGVTNYLDAEAVDSVLRLVAACVGRTRLIFTYVHRGAVDGSVVFEGAAQHRRNMERLGEPWTFGLFPEELSAFLRARGLRLEKDLGARDYRRECYGESAEGMKGFDFYHLAMAAVAREPGY